MQPPDSFRPSGGNVSTALRGSLEGGRRVIGRYYLAWNRSLWRHGHGTRSSPVRSRGVRADRQRRRIGNQTNRSRLGSGLFSDQGVGHRTRRNALARRDRRAGVRLPCVVGAAGATRESGTANRSRLMETREKYGWHKPSRLRPCLIAYLRERFPAWLFFPLAAALCAIAFSGGPQPVSMASGLNWRTRSFPSAAVQVMGRLRGPCRATEKSIRIASCRALHR